MNSIIARSMLVFFVSGCLYLHNIEDKASSPASLTAAVASVEGQLQSARALVLSDAVVNKQRFATSVLAQQCAAGTNNPIVPVLGNGIQLTLQGQVNESGTFTVSATPSGGGAISHQSQQTLLTPIAFVSLSNVPEFYLGQLMTNLQYVASALSDKATPSALALANKEFERVLSEVQTVTDETSKALAAFNAGACPANQPPQGPVIPTPAHNH